MTCIDYLLASTEYESFMQLAYDHAQLSQYQPEEGAGRRPSVLVHAAAELWY
jgi:hypothetical protein